jgi:hypothetical protein
MLAVKIDNPDMENQFKHYAMKHKKTIEDVISDAMKLFLSMQKKDDKLVYTKKDPMQYIHKIEYEYDDLCDDVALTHIEDSAKYIHDLRRKNRYE